MRVIEARSCTISRTGGRAARGRGMDMKNKERSKTEHKFT